MRLRSILVLALRREMEKQKMTQQRSDKDDDALQRLWCEAIVATQDGSSGRMMCDVAHLLMYVNTRKDAIVGPESRTINAAGQENSSAIAPVTSPEPAPAAPAEGAPERDEAIAARSTSGALTQTQVFELLVECEVVPRRAMEDPAGFDRGMTQGCAINFYNALVSAKQPLICETCGYEVTLFRVKICTSGEACPHKFGKRPTDTTGAAK